MFTPKQNRIILSWCHEGINQVHQWFRFNLNLFNGLPLQTACRCQRLAVAPAWVERGATAQRYATPVLRAIHSTNIGRRQQGFSDKYVHVKRQRFVEGPKHGSETPPRPLAHAF